MIENRSYPQPFPPSCPTVFGNRDFPLGCFLVDGQDDSPLHTHDYDELVIIMEGRGVHMTPRGRYPIKGGDVFLIQRGSAHGYEGCRRLRLANIYVRWDELELPLYDLEMIPGYRALTEWEPLTRDKTDFNRRLSLEEGELLAVEELFNQLNGELEREEAGYRFSGAALFMKLLLHLSRSYDSHREDRVRDLLLLSRLTGAVKGNLSGQITAAFLADRGDCSVRTVQRIFKKELGCTPVEYVTQRRIERARTLLRETALTVAGVGERCGYGDSNYFSRVFKENTGRAPREYRRLTTG